MGMLTRRSVGTPQGGPREKPADFMVRIAALLLLIGGTLAAVPAAAQFGNIFGDAPPRPPADIPNGPFPQQPPPVQYPGQAPRGYPGQPAPGYYPPPPPPGTVETQPLPPPPGASIAPVPPVQSSPQRPPAPGGRSAAAPPASGTPTPTPPPAAEAPPPDDTVVEAPTPHIDNGKAVFSGLDKITGRTTSFDVAIGETVQFGALQVTPRACYTRPPTEATNTDAFVEVDEVTLQGEIKRIFTGWMYASSPGLHAVEHPIYDVWLTDCASPQQIKVAEPAPKPPPTPAPGPAPKPRPPAPPANQRPKPPLAPAQP
jgi:hypothetical protein